MQPAGLLKGDCGCGFAQIGPMAQKSLPGIVTPSAAQARRSGEASGSRSYFGGAGVNVSRLWLGSGLGFGLGAFLTSFLPLSLLPMVASVPQTRGTRQGRLDSGVELSRGILAASFCPRGSGVTALLRSDPFGSVQKHRPVEGVALDGLEAGVANDSPQLFFRGAVGRSRSFDHVLFQHHRAHIVAAEVKT